MRGVWWDWLKTELDCDAVGWQHICMLITLIETMRWIDGPNMFFGDMRFVQSLKCKVEAFKNYDEVANIT